MPKKTDTESPNEVFADGIGWIGFHAGVVRIEFFSLGAPGTPDGAAEKEPERVVRQRIIMPLEGFMRSLGAMTDLVKKLEDGGMIVRRPGGAVAAVTAEAPAAARKTAGPAKSPNFG